MYTARPKKSPHVDWTKQICKILPLDNLRNCLFLLFWCTGFNRGVSPRTVRLFNRIILYNQRSQLIAMFPESDICILSLNIVRHWSCLLYYHSRNLFAPFSCGITAVHCILLGKWPLRSPLVMIELLQVLLPANSNSDVWMNEVQLGAHMSVMKKIRWRLSCSAVWSSAILH